mmetsp:Transcript_12780/g.27314  ORF Transcript_12780/g.27314 Transcript_12780/m.27314 type:complete len:222 (+) Transcript_12780:794-1459(+)
MICFERSSFSNSSFVNFIPSFSADTASFFALLERRLFVVERLRSLSKDLKTPELLSHMTSRHLRVVSLCRDFSRSLFGTYLHQRLNLLLSRPLKMVSRKATARSPSFSYKAKLTTDKRSCTDGRQPDVTASFSPVKQRENSAGFKPVKYRKITSHIAQVNSRTPVITRVHVLAFALTKASLRISDPAPALTNIQRASPKYAFIHVIPKPCGSSRNGTLTAK